MRPLAAPEASKEGAGRIDAKSRHFDLLRLPGIGGFLRWRHARTMLQSIMLGLAALLILDGLFGPTLAPRNLAGVLPWVHWRGFVVLALLVAGNLFCMACPFMLPRRLAKRILPGDRVWPAALRSKWLALGLLVLFFWAYEAFQLWSSPWLTAWIALSYFAAAFVIDGFFRGASFCKYVCPIGQFHFVNSMVSPLEVKVREPSVCLACTTKDCIRGRFAPETPLAGRAGRLLQNGCELNLFQERKVGNLDCTFCMECIHACPHDNVGIILRQPGREIWDDSSRSGVGQLSRRTDLAALALLLTFGAFVNAFGMVAPVHRLLGWVAETFGIESGLILTGGLFLSGLVVLPSLLVLATGMVSGRLSGSRDPLMTRITKYAYSLVPLGFGMWLAHYLYHFLLSGWSVIPLVQSYLGDLGFGMLGAPLWGMGPMVPESWLFPMQLFFLELGLLVSLATAYRIARREHDIEANARRAMLPWGMLAFLLSGIGIWLLLQPMEMRGMIGG